MDAECQKIPLYNTVTIALLVVHYVLMFAGVAYVALHRVVVRRKLRIKVRQRLLGRASLSEVLPCHWQWVHVACALRPLSRCGAHVCFCNHHAVPATHALVLHQLHLAADGLAYQP